MNDLLFMEQTCSSVLINYSIQIKQEFLYCTLSLMCCTTVHIPDGICDKYNMCQRIHSSKLTSSLPRSQEPMEWTQRVCNGVRCRRPVCICHRLQWMTLFVVATLISSLD